MLTPAASTIILVVVSAKRDGDSARAAVDDAMDRHLESLRAKP